MNPNTSALFSLAGHATVFGVKKNQNTSLLLFGCFSSHCSLAQLVLRFCILTSLQTYWAMLWRSSWLAWHSGGLELFSPQWSPSTTTRSESSWHLDGSRKPRFKPLSQVWQRWRLQNTNLRSPTWPMLKKFKPPPFSRLWLQLLWEQSWLTRLARNFWTTTALLKTR